MHKTHLRTCCRTYMTTGAPLLHATFCSLKYNVPTQRSSTQPLPSRCMTSWTCRWPHTATTTSQSGTCEAHCCEHSPKAAQQDSSCGHGPHYWPNAHMEAQCPMSKSRVQERTLPQVTVYRALISISVYILLGGPCLHSTSWPLSHTC